jgi:hypothetical protein
MEGKTLKQTELTNILVTGQGAENSIEYETNSFSLLVDSGSKKRGG